MHRYQQVTVSADIGFTDWHQEYQQIFSRSYDSSMENFKVFFVFVFLNREAAYDTEHRGKQ